MLLFFQVLSFYGGSSGEVSMVSRASRTSDVFDDLRGQIFTNVAVYKVCKSLKLTRFCLLVVFAFLA